MSHCLKKALKSSSCAKGIHTYIAAVWKKTADKEVCELFVCQNCMTHFDKTEREIMCKHYKDELEKEDVNEK